MDIIKLLYYIACYLIGAVPTAFIVFKLFTGKDVRDEGSGNVGAMNVYESSGKKIAGVIALFADASKGVAAVLFARLCFGDYFLMTAIAAVLAVAGHNYSVFLKFKGGRGLATAAGALLFINYLPIVIWVALWCGAFYFIKRNVHTSNVFACIASVVIMFNAPEYAAFHFDTMNLWEYDKFSFMYLAINIIILARHIAPLKELFHEKKPE